MTENITRSEKVIFKLAFVLFVFLHALLFNINLAEWGDSYRILRASEFIRNFTYPEDEKRPPLFSFVLALRPTGVDQILWGRLYMFALSVVTFFLFYKYCLLFINKYQTKYAKEFLTLSLLLFALNPVLLYWSIRIYADLFLLFLVLLCFYLLDTWRDGLNFKKAGVLGFIAGLAVLTRFEGYLLFLAIWMGLLFVNGADSFREVYKFFSQKFLDHVSARFWLYFYYCLGFIATISFYLYYRNPLTSTYLTEPYNRKYDVQTLAIYLLSYLFILGFVPAFYFWLRGFKVLKNFFCKNTGLGMFLLMESVLVLVWPAAVPRLFMPVLPFLVVLTAFAVIRFFEAKEKITSTDYLILGVVCGFYLVGQHLLRLQFLAPHRYVFIIVLVLQLPILYLLFKRRLLWYFIACVGLSAFVWSITTIYLHRDTYSSLQQAASYAQENLDGKVIYNDVNGVVDWYLNGKDRNDGISGEYVDFDNFKTALTYVSLKEEQVSYVIITNEHNTSLRIDLTKRPYLSLLKEFKYTRGGREFFSWIVFVQ